jgi:hypothetical protein
VDQTVKLWDVRLAQIVERITRPPIPAPAPSKADLTSEAMAKARHEVWKVYWANHRDQIGQLEPILHKREASRVKQAAVPPRFGFVQTESGPIAAS